MTPKWFINLNNQVSGPYNDDEVFSKAHEKQSALIWGRGLSAWMPLSEWKLQKDKLFSESTAASPEVEVRWTFKSDDKIFGPYSYADLIEVLKGQENVAQIQLRLDRPEHEWRDIHHYMQVVDDLGITRRQHPRVPIRAYVEGYRGNEKIHVNVITISEGGFGVNDSTRFQIGDFIKGTLSSDHLFSAISFNAEVVYVGGDGYTGFKFTQIPLESQTMITEYVKKFVE